MRFWNGIKKGGLGREGWELAVLPVCGIVFAGILRYKNGKYERISV